MSFQDKTLKCSDCGVTFTFSDQDQECFRSKGYINELKYCSRCGKAKMWGLHLIKTFENQF